MRLVNKLDEIVDTVELSNVGKTVFSTYFQDEENDILGFS